MSKIAILTDSSCDIPQEMAEKYGIEYQYGSNVVTWFSLLLFS